ncbi:hypothetical protein OZX65_06295 [Leuconostocaceae bacterium ESL0723]|nr:hypothetical protein OZX65_06295 [Leuconostocaceae bacterium ESL0723]
MLITGEKVFQWVAIALPILMTLLGLLMLVGVMDTPDNFVMLYLISFLPLLLVKER